MDFGDARNEDFKRALEALRNGVPNRDAVRFLGCGQGDVEQRFRGQLAQVEPCFDAGAQEPGMLISGGFGTGKSHLLEYLQHVAVEEHFVCSRVVISKETPLYDPAKVFLSAVESAVARNIAGQAIQAIALSLSHKSREYAELYLWASEPQAPVAPLFAATLMLHERANGDPELMEEISGFWSGQKLAIARVREALKQIGQAKTFPVAAVKARELPFQRFLFAARLMRAAGYRGWVLLIDEVELAAKYSLLQRAKSYGEVARWLGRLEGQQYPALTSVAAITDAFASDVLRSEGTDLTMVGERLRAKGTEEHAATATRAEAGMRIIDRDGVKLAAPSDETLRNTYATLRNLHSAAYGWDAPDLVPAERAQDRPMRSYVRRWINELDITRLYPNSRVTIHEDKVTFDFSEDPEFDQPPEDDAESPTTLDF